MLENVQMKKEYIRVINYYLGVIPVLINSSLVSAQNRNRLYWSNIDIRNQPEDKNLLLKDIIENGIVDEDKSYCIDANYYKNGSLENYLKKKRRQNDNLPSLVLFQPTAELPISEGHTILRERGHGYLPERIYEAKKIPSLVTSYSEYFIVCLEEETWRKLTPIECERLQTLEDNYTDGVSNAQRYKMLGSGWTVDVICHIFSFLKYPSKKRQKIDLSEQMSLF